MWVGRQACGSRRLCPVGQQTCVLRGHVLFFCVYRILSNATLNMDGKRIINVAYPRDPVENSAYSGDVVTAKALSDFRKYLLDEVLLRNSDNVMDGRLEMSGHKIKGLGNPVDSGDAVNKEYITARLKAVSDELNSMLERINKLEKNKT